MLCNSGTKLPDCDCPSRLSKDFNTFFITKIKKICESFSGSPLSLESDTHNLTSYFSSFINVTDDFVLKTIMGSPKSSSIVDILPTSVLIDHIDILLPYISFLFNSSLSEGVFPGCFKNACVRPLLKKTITRCQYLE